MADEDIPEFYRLKGRITDFFEQEKWNAEEYRKVGETGEKKRMHEDAYVVKPNATTGVDRYAHMTEDLAEYIRDRYEDRGRKPVTIRILDVGASDGRAVTGLKAQMEDYLHGRDPENRDREIPYVERISETLADVDPDDVTIEVVEYDYSREMLERGQEQDTVENPVRGVGQELPFDDGSFDVVICQNMLHYFSDDERATVFGELDRVEKGDGRAYIREG